MKKRFTEEQIIPILKEAEAGLPVKELCRKYNISDATFYTWRKKYGGLEVSEARRLKALEEENARLKKLLAESMLDTEALKAGHYPTLDLNISYGETDIDGLRAGNTGGTSGSGGATRTGNGTTTEGVIGVTLNVPLYSGGGTQAGVRQQRSRVTAADEALSTVRRDVRVDTRSFFRSVNTNIESASALEQTIVSRRSALDATRAGYDVGTRNIVEVLDAERDYYEALQNYANARYDYILNSLRLKQSAGTLSPDDLIQLNRWLSASAPGIEAIAGDDETIEDPTQD